MNSRRTTLIVAVVLALGTGWLTLNYLSSLQRANAANNQPRQILVAAQDIPARVVITPAMLARVSRPISAVDPDSVLDPSRAVGSLTLISIPAGSTITNSEIGHPSDVGLPVRLKPGMRAVSIQIDKVKGVSGLIQPGDYVDVIAVPPKTSPQPPPAATILRGIRVLAIGESLEYTSATPSPQEANSTTITLEVTPKQADLLAMADLNTALRLALRSPREHLNSEPTEALNFPTPPPSAQQNSGPPAVALQPRQVDPPAQPRRPAYDPAVTIIDGDHLANSGSQQ